MSLQVFYNVNTIEFNGQKAVINSYSDHPALVKPMNGQREAFASKYPRATVLTERMDEIECRALVANGINCHAVGAASLNEETGK